MSEFIDDDDDDDYPEIAEDAPLLSHTELLQQLHDCLAKRISHKRLSQWAVDHFYKIEMGEERPEPAYEETILAVLDDLMFSDDPEFALDDADIQALIARFGVS